jgi:hypothetical protein
MNEDVVLLWPLLFDGAFHFDPQDPLEQELASIKPYVIGSGTGWDGNRYGEGYSVDAWGMKFRFRLWEGQT